MARKGKGKNKAVHRHPAEHPLVTRNRKQRDKQLKKRLDRLLKASKRKRKFGTPEPAISCHETSVEDNEAEEISDRSLSTTPLPSSSSDEVEGWGYVFDNNYKSKKKTRVTRTSAQVKPTKADHTEDSKSQKNIAETSSTSVLISSPTLVVNYSDMAEFIKENEDKMQAGLSFKSTLPIKVIVPEPDTPITRASMQKKSIFATGPEVSKLHKKTTEFGQFKITDTKTGNVFSKSKTITYLGDTRLPKDETKIQSVPRKEDFTRKMEESKTLTPGKTIKHKEFQQSNLQKVPLKVSPEKLTIKENLAQKKRKTEKKFSIDKENQHRPLSMSFIKYPYSAISGVIRVLDLKKPFEKNEEEYRIYSIRNSEWKLLHIKENNIQIFIVVYEGIQLISNRMEQTVDWTSQVNLESRPGALEDQTTATSDTDVRTVPEKVEETLLNPSNLDKDNFESSLLTVQDQTAVKMQKNIKSDEGHNEETADSSSNLNQYSLEFFPQKLKDEFTVNSHPVVHLKKEHHDDTTMDSSTLGRNDVEICTQTLESQSTATSDEDVKFKEQYDETPANTSDVRQYSANLYPQASGDQSTSWKDVSGAKQHDKTPADYSNFEQDDTKTCPQPLEIQDNVAYLNLLSELKSHIKILGDVTNLSQDNVESCPQAMKGQTAGILEKVVRTNLKQSEETSVDSSSFEKVDVGSFARKKEGPSMFASDKEVVSVPEKHEETASFSINLDQVNVKSRDLTLEEESTIVSDKDTRTDPEKHDETNTDLRLLNQKDVESCLPTMEGESTIASKKDVRSDPEMHGETPTSLSNFNQKVVESCLPTSKGGGSTIASTEDTKANPKKHDETPAHLNNWNQKDVESCLPKYKIASEKDIRINPEKNDETQTNPSNSENRRVAENLSENVSSALKRLEENIQGICKEFSENFTSAFKNFMEEIMENFRAKKE